MINYKTHLTAEEIQQLKDKGAINEVLVEAKGVNHDMPWRANLIVTDDHKVRMISYPRAHFSSVVVVEDDALVLTRSEAKKITKVINENNEFVMFDQFKQYTETQLKDKSVKEWLEKLEAKKQGKLDISSQALTAEYNAWRASQGYCRATSLVLDSDNNIREAVEAQYSDPIEVYQIVEQPKVDF